MGIGEFFGVVSRCRSCLCDLRGGCFTTTPEEPKSGHLPSGLMYRSDGMALIRWASETDPRYDFTTTLEELVSGRRPFGIDVPFGPCLGVDTYWRWKSFSREKAYDWRAKGAPGSCADLA